MCVCVYLCECNVSCERDAIRMSYCCSDGNTAGSTSRICMSREANLLCVLPYLIKIYTTVTSLAPPPNVTIKVDNP